MEAHFTQKGREGKVLPCGSMGKKDKKHPSEMAWSSIGYLSCDQSY